MWREAGLLRSGILWTASALALACGGSSSPPDSPLDTSSAAPEPQHAGAAHELDVNMSFAEDEAEPESEEEASSRYTPPPTKTYSPATRMSEADRPGKK
ncbi:MAG: hypothetical protein JW940_31520 [Polyangiaceae bacterium]|nr:hypothetical protein [Polyangiaceae bacterium]